jgi:hypothetical protein
MPDYLSVQAQANLQKMLTENDREFAYRTLQARSEYLALRLRQDPEIRRIYVAAVEAIARKIESYKSPSLTRRHYEALQKTLTLLSKVVEEKLAENLVTNITRAIETGAAPLETQLQSALLHTGTYTDTIKLQRGFGLVNQRAVEAHYARVRNGMTLSDRIWNKGQQARTAINDIISEAVATGRDSVQVAADLRRYVNEGAETLAKQYPNMMKRMSGRHVPKDLSYEGLRLARTEMSAAFLEGTYAGGYISPNYKGVRWLLSNSHPITDICDDLSIADSDGLGPGGYAPGNEPPLPHPCCLCTAVPIAGDTTEFANRLRAWRNGAEDAELDRWYNDIFTEIIE